nr:hypothetical protein [Paenibacillus xylanexedens]
MFYTGNNRNLKISPYEPCPCHPDKKFKFCCYNKAKKDKPAPRTSMYSIGRVNHSLRKAFSETDFKICFGFDEQNCSGPIKSAHTLQNNRILDRISDDGHLYHFATEVVEEGAPPISIIKKISRNDASTFFGFCDYHDTELFKPIELRNYNNEPEQDFLFAFRSLALEMHKKERFLSSVIRTFNEKPRLMLNEQNVYLYRLAQVDIKDHKTEYNTFKENYVSNNFAIMRTLYRKLDFEVKFATSASIAVQYDLHGKSITDAFDLSGERVPSIFLTIYPTKNGTTDIIISYLLIDDYFYSSYFDSLDTLSDENLLKYLNYLIIESTENIFLSSSYLDGLNELERESLERSYNSSMNIIERTDLLISDNYYKFSLFD